jgi:hypothetical protein
MVGDGYVESGVDTGVSGGVDPPDEGDDWFDTGGYDC